MSYCFDDYGWCLQADIIKSPNFDDRPQQCPLPDLIVIHAISLPPQDYGGQGVLALFSNLLDPNSHPYCLTVAHLKVSAHFFIRRSGQLIQLVAVNQRAWHAGASSWQGRSNCNDFSLGIELEGSDFDAFTEDQYAQLIKLIEALLLAYPSIKGLVGHSDIAPERKTDPGPYFSWTVFDNLYKTIHDKR